MLIYKDCIEESEGLQYICDPCEITEAGGVRSLCLLKKGTIIPNPYTQLDIDILVGAGLMHVMAETRGMFDGGTPKMITGYGDNKERNIGSDYVLQVKDPIFSDNYDFWQAVEKIEDWNIAFRTETQLAVVSDDVTITTKAPAEEGLDTEVVWNIECKWFSKNKPAIQPYSGKFDTVLKTLDIIYGGTIANGGAVKLTIDSDKTGYVLLPNGKVLTTVAGVIDTTYSGVGGAITYYVPKNSILVEIIAGNLAGQVNYNGVQQFDISTSLITSVIADNAIGLDCNGSRLLTTVSADSADVISCINCALTADSIAAILRNIVVNSYTSRTVLINGGTNAAYSTWSAQAQSDLATILNDLDGTVSYVGE